MSQENKSELSIVGARNPHISHIIPARLTSCFSILQLHQDAFQLSLPALLTEESSQGTVHRVTLLSFAQSNREVEGPCSTGFTNSPLHF